MLNLDLQAYKSDFAAGAHSELRLHKNTSRRVTLLNGELIGNLRQDSSGVSARVLRKGLCGFASDGVISAETVRAVLKAASDNAAFMERRVVSDKGALPAQERGTEALRLQTRELEQRAYIDLAKRVDAHIAAECPSLISRRVVVYSDSQEKRLAVSDGRDAHLYTPRCYVYVFMTAEGADGKPVEIFKSYGGFGFIDERFADLGWLWPQLERLYRQVLDKAKGVQARAGLQTVVLSGELAGMLAHEAVGHTVEADLVLGGSVAGKMRGRAVASEIVSLVDFAHTVEGQAAPLPVFVDDEGVAAEDAVLIKDGILTAFMHNRLSAQHFGDRPQGNARAWSFSDEPLIRMRNTAVIPGTSSLEEMIASVKDGYYLMQSGNGQADTTGEFMFGVSMGYEIKDGKLGRALLDTTISGVAFEMLKTVDMVGDTYEWTSSGFCGKKQPMAVGIGGPALRCRVMMGGQ